MNTTTENRPAPVEACPRRLQFGYWCHQQNKTLDQGDINGSYSADLIGMEGRIRKPFWLQGCLWVTTSKGHLPAPHVIAYRLVSSNAFIGTPTTYREKTLANHGDDARRDPRGFYHGMTVKQGRQEYVLTGPPIQIVEGQPEPTQSELF